jgi:hypothetical protein
VIECIAVRAIERLPPGRHETPHTGFRILAHDS